MKKAELKSLIKECVREVLFHDEGILSNIIAEVALGVTKAHRLTLEEQQLEVKANKSG